MSTFILGRNVILAQLANVGVSETDLNAMSPTEKTYALKAVANGVNAAAIAQLLPFQTDYHNAYLKWIAFVTEYSEIQIAVARSKPVTSVPEGG